MSNPDKDYRLIAIGLAVTIFGIGLTVALLIGLKLWGLSLSWAWLGPLASVIGGFLVFIGDCIVPIWRGDH